MATRVSPTEKRPTNHISLTHGATTIGLTLCNGRGEPDPRAIRQAGMPRTALQTRTGDPDYSSYVLPYTPLTQKDWSNGRGKDDAQKDGAGYYDSEGANASLGDVVLGPGATATSVSLATQSTATYTTHYATIVEFGTVSVKFTATVNSIGTISMRFKSAVPYAIIAIHADSGGSIGTEIARGVTGEISTDTTATVTIGCALTIGTDYWVRVLAASGPEAIVEVYYVGATTDLYFSITVAQPESHHFFEYRGALYAVNKNIEGVPPTLWQNGYRGFSAANPSTRGQLWPGSALASGVNLTGKVVRIIAGPGSEEPVPWRVITSSTTTVISVSPNWGTAHTTATEWVVTGTDNWTEITGHGLTKPVTDVLVVDDIVYFAQGDATNIRRGQLAAGSWTWADDGTNKASFMGLCADSDGTRQVWRALATTSKVASSDVKAWATDLVLGTDIVCGNPAYKITGMTFYGNPLIPWIMKEDSFGSINAGVYAEVPIAEMRAVRSEKNGRAATSFGVYLFFSLLDGFERYYDNRLDDMGPNRDEGLPLTRQGPIVHAIPYPGGIIACIDAGTSGYSSITYWNQQGWHELYRGGLGLRITRMHVQVIDGGLPGRLWFSMGGSIYYLPMALVPRKQSGYTFAATGSVISGWFTGGFREVVKFWKDAQLYADNLVDGHQEVDLYFQLDNAADADAWTLAGTFDASPVDKVDLSNNYSVEGKRWRYKLVLRTDDTSKSPRVRALTVNSVTRVTPRKSWSITFRAADGSRTLDGRTEPLSAAALLAQIETWADSDLTATPLVAHQHMDGMIDNQYVFIDPASLQPYEVSEEVNGVSKKTMIVTMALYQA